MRTTTFRPNRQPWREQSIEAYEAAVLRDNPKTGAVCCHDHVGLAGLTPTLDNAARELLQKAGQSRCRVAQERAAQEATLAPDPLNQKTESR